MEPLRSEKQVADGGGRRSSASDHSSLSPVSGFNSPDGLGAPEDYCKQVCVQPVVCAVCGIRHQ